MKKRLHEGSKVWFRRSGLCSFEKAAAEFQMFNRRSFFVIYICCIIYTARASQADNARGECFLADLFVRAALILYADVGGSYDEVVWRRSTDAAPLLDGCLPDCGLPRCVGAGQVCAS